MEDSTNITETIPERIQELPKPFDYVKDIMRFKKNLIQDTETEKLYNPFLVNRALSFHQDCVMLANEMNLRPHTDKIIQNSFYLNTIRSRQRPFIKWYKPETNEHVEIVSKYYQVSRKKAYEILKLLSVEDIKELYDLMDTGGNSK